MANNYQQFSDIIPELTEAEKTWWSEAIGALENGDDESDGYVDFSWNFESDGSLWLYAEESGDIDQVCELVQKFFQESRPNGVFAFQWANTCSKPRVDEFGGGAAVVTRLEISQMTTSWWVKDEKERLEKALLSIKESDE